MDYVYDIVLNLQPNFYEFYEWQPKDKIINIKRLPIYKVSNYDYLNIKNNDVTIEISTLPKPNKIFLITSGIEIIGILIDSSGKVLKKSSLLFEESDDILEERDEIKSVNIKYIINKKKTYNFKSRITMEKIAYINNYLNKINKEKDKYFLKYLYYEIYTIDEENVDKILTNLNNLATNNPLKLYECIKNVNLELKRKKLSNN